MGSAAAGPRLAPVLVGGQPRPLRPASAARVVPRCAFLIQPEFLRAGLRTVGVGCRLVGNLVYLYVYRILVQIR